jgi:hypothetical protein
MHDDAKASDPPKSIRAAWSDPIAALGLEGLSPLPSSLQPLRDFVRAHRDRALMHDEVIARAVDDAWGGSTDEFIEHITEWERGLNHAPGALDAVWREAGRRSSHGLLDFTQKRRSGMAELNALRRLCAQGLRHQAHERNKKGNADWVLAAANADLIDVEVASITEDTEWLDVLDSALHGAILSVGMKRATDFRWTMLNEDEARASRAPETTDVEALVELIWSHRLEMCDTLEAWLAESRDALHDTRTFTSAFDGRTLAWAFVDYGDMVLAELSASGRMLVRFEFERPDEGDPLFVSPRQCVRAARYEHDSIPNAELTALRRRVAEVARKKAPVVAERRSSNRAIGARDLIVIHWNAPWNLSSRLPIQHEVQTQAGDALVAQFRTLAQHAEAIANEVTGSALGCALVAECFRGPVLAAGPQASAWW